MTNQHRSRRARWSAGVLGGAALLALLPARPARAEFEASVFGGAHFYSTDGSLSRGLVRDNPNSAFQHSGIFGLRLGYYFIPRLALEGELGVSPTETRGDLTNQPNSQPSVAMLPIRAHVLFNILTGRLRPFVLAGGGMHIGTPMARGALSTDLVGAIHVGAGAAVDIGKAWGLRLDGRAVFPQGFDKPLTTEGELLLSAFARFGAKTDPGPPKVVDSDGDGLLDNEDRCPSEIGPVANAGCADKDMDGDGVVDRLDKCSDKAGPQENGGCPDQDGDGDGVVDRLDKCPAKAGKAETGGCPEVDTDADGVPDKADRCPSEAGVAENNGCPDRDVDGDGVVDRLDKCPDHAEIKNNYQDEDGCPDEIPQALKQFTGAIQGINFAPNKAVILQASFKVLDKALAVLSEFPQVKLEISGHTDSSGDAEKNRKLSQERADAVRKYFLDKGVAEGRLKAVGYGPDKPLADNKTKAGREKNRRVEFNLIQ